MGSSTTNRYLASFLVAFLALVILCLADLSAGGSYVGAADFFKALFSGSDTLSSTIIWKLRLPRILTAVVCGSSLALGGALMQSIFANPLADPHIMGISSGSALGAALCSSFVVTAGGSVLSGMSVMLAAFIGAVASSILVLFVSSVVKRSSTLLLFGVLLGFVLSSVTTLTEYFASEQSLKVFYSWSCGNFSTSSLADAGIISAVMLVGLAISLAISGKLDIILFGDEYASVCGVRPAAIRFAALLACCLMTGVVTAVCGPLGFVGIISAHVARKSLGTSVHKKIIPLAMLVGAAFSVGADLLSQVWSTPLPAGSVMALVGAPVVVFVLFSEKQH